jgi:general secretion pathway protein K
MIAPKPAEKGVALLTVLILVAIIGALAASLLERTSLSTRSTINLTALSQARAYGLAAEEVAKSRLSTLMSSNSAKTTLDGDWLGRDLPFPIDGGTASIRLGDGGNCFNLNSLVKGNPGQGLTANPTAMLQFGTLLTILGVPANQATVLASTTTDWLDSDQAPLPGGGEDAAYANRGDGLRPPNQLMADAGEMAAIFGMDEELYELMRPWVCALPVAGASPINVNTLMPVQAPLIAMMIPGKLSVQQAKSLIELRPQGGFESGQNFWAGAAKDALTPPAEVVEQTQVKTRFFTLKTNVILAGAEHQQWSLVDYDKPPAKIIQRRFGGEE